MIRRHTTFWTLILTLIVTAPLYGQGSQGPVFPGERW